MNIYTRMDPYELVGHVNAIPDASELSQALAARLKELAAQVAFYQVENQKFQVRFADYGKLVAVKDNAITDLHKQVGIRDRKIIDLKRELEDAKDKIDGFMEATAPK